jgi:selenocysteine lyase/cysteine desulfurase
MTKWDAVRAAFSLDPEWVHLSAMSVTAHPAHVRWRIGAHRERLDALPFPHIAQEFHLQEDAAFRAAGTYFGVDPSLIALTASTTMGLAQVLNGIAVAEGQRIVTSAAEHFSTMRTLALRKERQETRFDTFPLYQRGRSVTAGEILDNIRARLTAETRLLTLAWVSSSDGVKLPVAEISALVSDVNAARPDPAKRLLFNVDGVHGFGVEDATFQSLGCDVFVSGCHKWLFGPRGTAIICAKPDAWAQIVPIVPTFSNPSKGPGRLHTPGGVHAYEHTFSVDSAFAYLMALGKADIRQRIDVLVQRLRSGLLSKGYSIETPASPSLSAGIVCFDGDEPAGETVARLMARQVLVTESGEDPGGRTHVRASLAIFNNEEDVDALLEAL